MPAILPSIKIDSTATLAKYFMPHQAIWIQADDYLHAEGKQAFALAEKSVRIGWTFCDAFKNVRKRLQHKKRDYLFVTKDYPSALEYITSAHSAAEFLDFTRAIVSHGEDYLKVNCLDPNGHPTSATEEVKIGYIKFDNGSRIIAFSSNPYAMAVYGGDVGLDEFAKHPNAKLLWETAQGRVALGHDMAVWSAHDGEDTLFNQFAQEARAGAGPWNLYYHVTLADAIELGLLDVINRTQGKYFTPDQFLASCRARAGSEEIFQQSYMCNPLGAATASIVEWSAIERCRTDYQIERVHLEDAEVRQHFDEFNPSCQDAREDHIEQFLSETFSEVLQSRGKHRLGFDVAASGQGDLAAFYIDELKGSELWLRALLTVRTEDWNFLKTVLYYFLRNLKNVQGAGDESGLGRQICWEAASKFGSRFLKVNFAGKKHDLGFSLMNQLHVAEKRFPRAHQDIAADFFALRKVYTGTRWVFNEGRNTLNPASHCDIAWAGALATYAHTQRKSSAGGCVVYDHWDGVNDSNAAAFAKLSPQDQMLWSNDHAIWRPLR
jgi:phage FluMu gp28-like protein